MLKTYHIKTSQVKDREQFSAMINRVIQEENQQVTGIIYDKDELVIAFGNYVDNTKS